MKLREWRNEGGLLGYSQAKGQRPPYQQGNNQTASIKDAIYSLLKDVTGLDLAARNA
jgi:hypothetical protein